LIRNATLDDIPRISEIQICGWRFAYRGIISDYELFSERLVIKSIKATTTRFENNCAFIVYEDQTDKIIKGFAWHGVSRDDDKEVSYEINAIYVQPEFTRNGIGKLMLNYIAQYAKDNKYNELLIWVLAGNNKGIEFYKKNKFIEDGKRKYIEKWDKEEIRMVKTI
jgi:GNAT superfamily N-acetyltransferase